MNEQTEQQKPGEVSKSAVERLVMCNSQEFEWFIRVFWRRIYAYRNHYEKELPEKLPVEFKAHMETALSLFPSVGSKTPETLDRAKKLGCLICEKKPKSVSPLDEGFGWDTVEPTNPYLFCDKCLGT